MTARTKASRLARRRRNRCTLAERAAILADATAASGAPARAREETPPVIVKRMETLCERDARDPRAGSAIGCLLLHGCISDRQHEAGNRYAALVRRFRALGGVPYDGREQSSGEHEADPEEWARVRERMTAIDALIGAQPEPRLIRHMLDLICLQDSAPPWLGRPPSSLVEMMDLRLQQLRAALDALADWWRVPREERRSAV